MQVKICKTLNEVDEIDLEITNLREVLSGIKMIFGQEYTNKLLAERFKYVLIPFNETEEPIALCPEVVLSDISNYKTLLIIPEVSGSVPAAAVAGWIYGAAAATAVAAGTATLTTTLVSYAIAAVINIAISMALNLVMSLISPTKEFSSDPAAAQKTSNLFNGAPMITEQGGSVPLAFGYGFAGGVLISSSISTVEE